MPRTNRMRRNPQAVPDSHLCPSVRGIGGRLSFEEVGKMTRRPRKRSVVLSCGCRFIEEPNNSDGVVCRRECRGLLSMYEESRIAHGNGDKAQVEAIHQRAMAHWWDTAREAAIRLGKLEPVTL